jgi:hypothetical protein
MRITTTAMIVDRAGLNPTALTLQCKIDVPDNLIAASGVFGIGVLGIVGITLWYLVTRGYRAALREMILQALSLPTLIVTTIPPCEPRFT